MSPFPLLVFLALGAAQAPSEGADNALGFDSLPSTEVHAAAQADAPAPRLKDPVEGKDRTVITWPEFYEAVGKPDLAEAYRSKDGVKKGVRWGGVGVTLAGVAVTAVGTVLGMGIMVVTLVVSTVANLGGSNALLFAGIGTGVGVLALGLLGGLLLTVPGVAMLGASKVLGGQPVDDREIVRLADDYNQKLPGAAAPPPDGSVPPPAP